MDKGTHTNLYKSFIMLSWKIGNKLSITGFVHDYGVYDDPKGSELRKEIYIRLKWTFRFYNQLNLFPEDSLGHAGQYCISVLYNLLDDQEIKFKYISNLFHPKTIDLCVNHDGIGELPGIKNDRNDWNTNGHLNRLINITSRELMLLARVYEEENSDISTSRLPIIHSNEVLTILNKFTDQNLFLSDLIDDYYATYMFHETYAQRDNLIIKNIEYPKDISSWVISGPHFYVANPLAKTPRENCSSKGDYDKINLNNITDNYLPRTIYQPTNKGNSSIVNFKGDKITNYYRYINRKMASPTNERTLISAIIPPNVTHIHGALSLVFSRTKDLLNFSSFSFSIVYDFFVRLMGKQNVQTDILNRLPIIDNPPIQIISRSLRLNCLTDYYSSLWESFFNDNFKNDSWANDDPRLKTWSTLTKFWQKENALRTDFDRRQALLEIDVLAALVVGLKLEELLAIYKTQFPILQNYEREFFFDQRGYVVPVKTVNGELKPNEDHESFNEMVPPFTTVDREADYRQAWAHFERVLSEKGEET
jgi:hypothetical protein